MAQPQGQLPPRLYSPAPPTSSTIAPSTLFSGVNGSNPARPTIHSTQTAPAIPMSLAGTPMNASAARRPSPNAASPPPVASPSLQQPQTRPVTGLQTPSTPYTNGTYASPRQGYTQIGATSPSPYPGGLAQPPPNLYPPQPAATNAYTNASFSAVQAVPPTPGTMGPPTKPVERPTKEHEYDVSDVFAGTGIDLREEESKLQAYYTGSYLQGSRTGLANNAPGGKDSFYGAGFANQPGEGGEVNQKAVEAAIAHQAWTESATRLSAQRAQEQNNQFLQYANLHYKAGQIAKQYGLELNLDTKGGQLQKSKPVSDAVPESAVTITTRTSKNGALVSIYGSVLPADAFLIDQLALLSIASKHRVREMIEDADKIAVNRQQTSHGVIPAGWADAGVPLENGNGVVANTIAAAPNGSSLKRAHSMITTDGMAGSKMPVNSLVISLKQIAAAERAAEEARLVKRQKRLAAQGDTAVATSTPRTAPATPAATPGSIAPEPKATAAAAASGASARKEKKRARIEAPADTNLVNRTSNAFLGKKKKAYAWMTGGAAAGGGGASGTSTPARPGSAGAAGTPGADAGGAEAADAVPAVVQLTKSGRNTLGYWREYEAKGKNIQLRDWVAVLERDGRDKMALQYAYDKLDDAESR